MVGSDVNPFRYSGPVPAADLVDRDAERQAITDLARSGHNAHVTAPRRYGQTSLPGAAPARADAEGWTCGYVDFFGVLTRPASPSTA
jgi:hypothetical protein